MKSLIIVVMLLAFLALANANPTLSSHHDVETSPKTTNINELLAESYLQNLQSQVALPEGINFDCSEFIKRELLDKILEKIKAESALKLILKKSVKFLECASRACNCLKLRIIPPLFGACLGIIGGICLEEALKPPHSSCILTCASNYNNNQLLDDAGIVDMCHNKCQKIA